MGEMLQGMITEEELMKLLGIKKAELSRLRHEKGMPFVKLSSIRRVYLEKDLMAWFARNQIVLNRNEIPITEPTPVISTDVEAISTDEEEHTREGNKKSMYSDEEGE